jgi:hypothetical protein
MVPRRGCRKIKSDAMSHENEVVRNARNPNVA